MAQFQFQLKDLNVNNPAISDAFPLSLFPIFLVSRFKREPAISQNSYNNWHERAVLNAAKEGTLVGTVRAGAVQGLVVDTVINVTAAAMEFTGSVAKQLGKEVRDTAKRPLGIFPTSEEINAILDQVSALDKRLQQSMAPGANMLDVLIRDPLREALTGPKPKRTDLQAQPSDLPIEKAGKNLSAIGFFMNAQNREFEQKLQKAVEVNHHQLAYDLSSGFGQVTSLILAGTVNPQLAIGIMTGNVAAREYLNRRSEGAGWVPSALFAGTLGASVGQLQRLTLGVLYGKFQSRWALAVDSSLANALQLSAMSETEFAMKSIAKISKTPFWEAQAQAAYEGALGFVIGGASGFTLVNAAHNRIQERFIEAGVPRKQASSIAAELLASGRNVVHDLLAESTGLPLDYFERQARVARGEEDPKPFFEETQSRAEKSVVPIVEAAKSTDEQINKAVEEQKKTDIAQSSLDPAENIRRLDLETKFQAAKKGRESQINSERKDLIKEIDRLEAEREQRLKDKKSVKAVDSKLNKLDNRLKDLQLELLNIDNAAIEDLKGQKLQLKEADLERLRSRSVKVGAQQEAARIKQQLKDKTLDIQEKKGLIVDYARKNLPRKLRGDLLVQVRDAKTDLNVQRAFEKIDRLQKEFIEKDLKERVAKAIDKLRPRTGKRPIEKGRFESAALQEVASKVVEIAELPAQDVQARKQTNATVIQDFLEARRQGKEVNFDKIDSALADNELLDRFGGIADRNVEGIARGLSELRRLRETLNEAGQQVREQKKAEFEDRVNKTVDETFPPGKKGGKLRALSKKRQRNFIQSALDNIFNGIEAVGNLLEGTVHAKDVENSEAVKLGKALEEGNRVEKALVSFYRTNIQEMLNTAFDLKKESQISERIRKDSSYREEDGAFIGKIELNTGETIELRLNKQTIRAWYAISHNLDGTEKAKVMEVLTGDNKLTALIEKAKKEGIDLDSEEFKAMKKDIKGNAIPKSDLNEIFKNNLSKEDKRFIELQKAFYANNFDLINSAYRRIFKTNLQREADYFPFAREFGGLDEPFSLVQDFTFRFGGKTPGSVMVRQKDIKTKFRTDIGDIDQLSSMVLEIPHFVGNAETVLNGYRLLTNKDVRRAINLTTDGFIDASGKVRDGQYYKSLLFGMDLVASRGRIQGGLNEIGRRINNNISSWLVSGQLDIGAAQVVSGLSALNFISPIEFSSGLKDFMKDPMAAIKVMEQSPIMKTRYRNMIIEIRDIVQSEKFNELAKSSELMPALRRAFFLPILLGNKGGIFLGGWPIFKTTFEKTGSHSEAFRAFDGFIEKTQQSANPTQLGEKQTKFWKLLFKFISQPIQYLRLERQAFRRAVRGQASVGKFIKSFFLFHFLIGGLFNYIKNAGSIDSKDLAEAMILGPLSSIPFLGTALEGAFMGLFMNKKNFESGTIIFDTVGDVENALFKSGRDLSQNNTNKAVQDLILGLSIVAGVGAGVPRGFSETLRIGLDEDLPKESIFLGVLGKTYHQVQNVFSDE